MHAMTSRIRAELTRRGHDAEVVHPDRLVTEVVRGRVVVHPFGQGRLPDAVVLTMSSDHMPAVHSAAQLELAGVPVVNRPSAVLLAADKIQTAVALVASGVPVPRAVSITTIDAALEHAPRVGYPLVLKAADGAEGNQVRYVANATELPAAVAALRASMGQHVWVRTPLILQEVMCRPLGRDRRVFVVNGVVQAAMDRVARVGEWRSNLSQGASPVRAVATEHEANIAVRAALALGLDFTTIDMMRSDDGAVVIEANSYGDILDVSMTSGMDLIGSLADLAEMTAGAPSLGPVEPRPLTLASHQEITIFCLARLRTKATELGLPENVATYGVP
jgi:ribosomal protein S6--L-glutamate ligase